MLLPSQEDLPAESVALILDIIRCSGFRTVHYTGRADENLLRGLLGVQPSLEVSVMDMPDRWGTGYAFHYDESEFGKTTYQGIARIGSKAFLSTRKALRSTRSPSVIGHGILLINSIRSSNSLVANLQNSSSFSAMGS